MTITSSITIVIYNNNFNNRIASEVQSSTSTTFTVEREDHSLANLIKG
jgi:DNA-directed RNA polymerase subunit L